MINGSLRRQRGMGLLGLLLIAMMVGFFVMSAIRIAPGYIEYLSIRDTVIRVAEEFDEDQDTMSDIRRKLGSYFNTNQIKAIDSRAVDLKREDGEVIIDASYEERIPLVWRIDAVIKYDDLVFVAGESYRD